MDLAAAKRTIERHVQWRTDALKAADQLLSGDHLEKLKGESWWRDQMNQPRVIQSKDDPGHFLPTTRR